MVFGSTSLLEILCLFNFNGLNGSEFHSEILFFGKKIELSNINK